MHFLLNLGEHLYLGIIYIPIINSCFLTYFTLPWWYPFRYLSNNIIHFLDVVAYQILWWHVVDLIPFSPYPIPFETRYSISFLEILIIIFHFFRSKFLPKWKSIAEATESNCVYPSLWGTARFQPLPPAILFIQRQQMTMPQIEAPPPVRKGESENLRGKLYLSEPPIIQ